MIDIASGLEPTLLLEAERAAIGRDRLHLLQRILRAVDADRPITDEATPLNSAVAGISRAIAVLESHSAGGQPRPWLVKAVCDSALSAVERMITGRGNQLELTGARAALQLVTEHAGKGFRSICDDVATALRCLDGDIEMIVLGDLVAYWDSTRLRAPTAEVVAREAGVLLLARERHEHGIRRSIEHFLRIPLPTGQALVEALFPTPRRFRVACVVDGADELRRLNELRPDARQFPLGTSVSGWGLANDRLEAYVRTMVDSRASAPSRRPACLVTVNVQTLDPESAAAIGRREISELLDIYVAGHRLVDLHVRDDVLASEMVGRSSHWYSAARTSVREAFPLSVMWPTRLSETMRMAHVARTTDSPMAAAAIAWSSIEAADLKRDELAGALALQTFRHRLVQTHGAFVTSVGASTKAKRIHERMVSTRARGLGRVVTNFDPAHSGRAGAVLRLAAAKLQLGEATAEVARHTKEVATCLDAIRGHVAWAEGGQLFDLNAWVDLLRPSHSSDPGPITEARAALTRLLPELSPATAASIQSWRSRLDTPSNCGRWLDAVKDRYVRELDWLYATRNLTIHSGQLSLRGDIQLAVAASGIADLALEFLGAWYAIAATKKPAASGVTPAQVAAQLEDRRSTIVRHLLAGDSLTGLHAEHLTSCTSNGWDR